MLRESERSVQAIVRQTSKDIGVVTYFLLPNSNTQHASKSKLDGLELGNNN